MALRGKTIFITGATRGIGLAIAKRAAKDGANIAIAAKSTKPNPKLPGTIYTAAEDIEACGGKALPLYCDITNEYEVEDAVKTTVDTFGGIDICINNASALSLMDITSTRTKSFDLMHQINVRGSFLVTRTCLPYLELMSKDPRIINMSPPLNFNPDWFQRHTAYTMSKYSMTMLVLGVAAEYASRGILANCLWPRTAIETPAIKNLIGAEGVTRCRKPEIVADAAYLLMASEAKAVGSGNCYIDDEVLERFGGVTNFDSYAASAENSNNLLLDFFVDAPPGQQASSLPNSDKPTKTIDLNAEVEPLDESAEPTPKKRNQFKVIL